MGLDAALYIAPLLVGGIVSLLLLVTLFPRRRSPLVRMFMLFLGAVCLWTFAYILELWAGDFSGTLLWRKVRYVGVCFTPVLWFCFAMRYSGREQCTRLRSLALLSIVPVVALAFLWLSGHEGLFFSEMASVTDGPFTVIRDSAGPFFWVQAAYGYLLVMAGIVFVLRHAATGARIYVRQALSVVAGILVPFLGNLFVVLGANPFMFPYDVTPALFPVAAVAVWWSIFRFRFLDMVPVARRALFDSLDDIIFVVDDRNRVIDGNPAAVGLLAGLSSSPEGGVIGRQADDMLSGYPELAAIARATEKTETELAVSADGQKKYYDVTTSPMYGRGGTCVGRLVTMRDITDRKEVENALRHRIELQELISGLSTHFINLPPDEVDDGIHGALRHIGRFVDVDRCYVFRFSDDLARMDNTHEWCAEDVEPQREHLQGLSTDSFPWWMERLRRFEVIRAPSVDDLPPAAMAEKDILQAQNIRSLVVVPMAYRQELVGFIGFDSVREEKHWSDETVDLLRLVGDIIVNALERKKAEGQRRFQRQYFQALFNDSPEAIVSLDRHHRVLDVNPSFRRLFGYTAEELKGENIDDYILPGEYEREGRGITDKVTHGQEVKTETVRQHKDGSEVYVSLWASPIFVDGEEVGIFGIYRDIRERKRAEWETWRRATQASLIYEVGQEVSGELDLQELLPKIVQAVRDSFTYFGVHLFLADEDTGNLHLQSIAGGYEEVFPLGLTIAPGEGLIGRAAETGETQVSNDVSASPHYVQKAGEVTMAEMAVPVKKGAQVIGVLDIQADSPDVFDESDVTAMETLSTQIAAAIENARLYEQAQREIAERQQAEKNLAELNEVLRLTNKILRHDILNDMQIAQSALELYREGEGEDMLERIHRRIQQSVELINRMRQLESLISAGGDMQTYDAGAVVAEAAEDHPVTCNVHGTCMVKADDAIHSVIDNILENAVVHGGADTIEVTIEQQDDSCMLRIADNGTGIPDDIKQQVFTEGFSHGGQAGTGLGLYIVKKTVERYGGSIAIEDNEPHGAVFVLRLPAGKNSTTADGQS